MFVSVKNCYVALKVGVGDDDESENQFSDEDANTLMGAAVCAKVLLHETDPFDSIENQILKKKMAHKFESDLLGHMAKCGQYYPNPTNVPAEIDLLAMVYPYHFSGNMKLSAAELKRGSSESSIMQAYLNDLKELCDCKNNQMLSGYLVPGQAQTLGIITFQDEIFNEAKYRADRFTFTNKELHLKQQRTALLMAGGCAQPDYQARALITLKDDWFGDPEFKKNLENNYFGYFREMRGINLYIDPKN